MLASDWYFELTPGTTPTKYAAIASADSIRPRNGVHTMNRRHFLTPTGLLPACSVWAQSAKSHTVTYAPDETLFPNPERGFFQCFNPPGRDDHSKGIEAPPHPPLRIDELLALRGGPDCITMVRDVVRIGHFWTSDISAARLAEIERDWAAVRKAGMKVLPRFVYSWGMENSDPVEAVVLRHVEQVGDLLHRNSDVIAWLQGGLLGGCGEGNASQHYVYDGWDNGSRRWQKLTDSGRRVYQKLLSVLPGQCCMTVRYPRFKWDLLGWDPATARALTRERAFDGSPTSRLGYYSDGFMGDEKHYAMFQLSGEGDYTAADTAYSIYEGEVSDDTPYKLQPGQVVHDMQRYHQTALNRDGDGWDKTSATWKTNGDYDVIARRMGYRFRLTQARTPEQAILGGRLDLALEIANSGFGRAINPRAIEIVLRAIDGRLYSVPHEEARGNRLALPGPGETTTLRISAGVPRTLEAGDYELLLNLPDPAPELYSRPEYSIRLANQAVWESATGFNRLQASVRLAVGATSGPVPERWFKAHSKAN